MALRLAFALLFILFLSSSVAKSSAVGGGIAAMMGFPTLRPRPCNAVAGDCVGDEAEFEMDSEVNRRILAYGQRRERYVSYEALNRNRVPCNLRGQSYYNCGRGQRANPYRRGCSVITRCARFLN